MSSSNDKSIINSAALRYVLRNLDPVSGLALAHLARAAKEEMKASDICDNLASRLINNLDDVGRFASDHIPVGSLDGVDAVALAAFRYSLGRMTSVVSTCSEWLAETWSNLSPETRETIVTETRSAIATGKAGQDIDCHPWHVLLNQVDTENSTVKPR